TKLPPIKPAPPVTNQVCIPCPKRYVDEGPGWLPGELGIIPRQASSPSIRGDGDPSRTRRVRLGAPAFVSNVRGTRKTVHQGAPDGLRAYKPLNFPQLAVLQPQYPVSEGEASRPMADDDHGPAIQQLMAFSN